MTLIEGAKRIIFVDHVYSTRSLSLSRTDTHPSNLAKEQLSVLHQRYRCH